MTAVISDSSRLLGQTHSLACFEESQPSAKDSDSEDDVDSAFAAVKPLSPPPSVSPARLDSSDGLWPCACPEPAVSRSSFQRHNSLPPNRVSGRSSMNRSRKTKTSAVPEFVQKQSLPSIRLKAPTARKVPSLPRACLRRR